MDLQVQSNILKIIRNYIRINHSILHIILIYKKL